jgi:HD-GYP domain-containing protein (c-di-GMP phosphodiesterase class II)
MQIKRIRFLYVILAVLVLASVGPLLFHSVKMLSLNRQALETNEQELQNTTTRSIADEISIYNENFHQILENLDRVLQIYTLMSGAPWDARSQELRATLEKFINPANHIIYVTYLDAQGRGAQAGSYTGESDPFMVKMLQRAFAAAQQRREYQSDPVLMSVGQRQFPAMLTSMPIIRSGGFEGMVAVVVNLQFLVDRLQASSTRRLQAFVIDRMGRLVLAPNLRDQSIGEDMSKSPIVQMFLTKGGDKAVATSSFDLPVGEKTVAMLGTYCPVPTLGWAVVAQKQRSDAYAAVDQMISATIFWGIAALLSSLVFSYFLSLRIVQPIRVLTDASRAIAKGDFSARVNLRSRTEIGELASTFNLMSADLELYIQQLKDAAERNRKLFLDSIHMIAAAVDEKDPYTHGHSERVSRYSSWIGMNLGLPEEEVEKVRISALLHDVGKIGIEDKILKKPGALTKEEFHIMMQHTQKGATIARRVAQLADMVPGIELHHESLDGKGYPFGLRGDEIPLMARIISVADTFDAMTTNRPYQSAMEAGTAIEYIASLGNKKYDANVIAALQSAYDSGQLKVTRAAALVAQDTV